MKKHISPAAYACCSALLCLLGSAPALAVTTSADMDASAGLKPVLSVICTPVKFGVWRVPLANSYLVRVILDAGTNLATGSPEMALSITADHQPSRGQCTVTGSAAADGTLMTIAAPSPGQYPYQPFVGDATAYSGLPAGREAAKIFAVLQTSATSAPINATSATFYVGGTATLTGDMRPTTYGGYKSASPFTIALDDLTP